jgi:hypothetical protein
VGCSYCGKEIGPIQLLKDGEFCSSAHRKSYGERLAKALFQISRPEPPPPAAGFLETITPQNGKPVRAARNCFYSGSGWSLEFPATWAVAIAPVLGSDPRRLPAAAPEARGWRISTVEAGAPRARAVQAPRFAIAPVAAASVAAAPNTWLAASAEPAAREVRPRECAAVSGRSFIQQARLDFTPENPLEPATRPEGAPAPVQAWRSAPGAEPASRDVLPWADPLQRRFDVHRAPGLELGIGHARMAASGGPAMGPAPASAAREVRVHAVPAIPGHGGAAKPDLSRASTLPSPGGALKSGEAAIWGRLEPAGGGAASSLPRTHMLPPARPALLPEMRLNADSSFDAPPEEPENYPMADLVPLEYHPQRVRGSHIPVLKWVAPRRAPRLPALSLGIPAEELDSIPLLTRRRTIDAPAPVVALPAPAPTAAKSTRWRAVGAIAAGLFAGLIVWGGANAVRIGAGTVINRDASAPDGPASPADARASAAAKRGLPGARQDAPSSGALAWVRAAVARRAAVDLTDSFRGMEAWGMPAATWAPGWSRQRDGYVRIGQLAIFNPSRELRNYRLEFFAQIESKSVGWAVRAHDRQNYYAMKFTVLEPGLRPVIAMVHYPVVGGKPGRRTEIPLSVMVHNNEPYRVAVEVKGNRVVTSIEGEEVDSWTDNTLASGGIGFFSEAGERARLYWMKVAVNNDFLGRICAYVAGAAPATATAAALPARPAGGAPRDPAAPAAAIAVLPFFTNRRKRACPC